MNKILVVKNCRDCPNNAIGDHANSHNILCLNNPDQGIPDWCSLPTLPERRGNGEVVTYTIGQPITDELAEKLINFGFNECLDVIFKEKEND